MALTSFVRMSDVLGSWTCDLGSYGGGYQYLLLSRVVHPLSSLRKQEGLGTRVEILKLDI